jgi:hypothetical protein
LYDDAFADLLEVKTPLVRRNRNHTYHLYVLRLDLEKLKDESVRIHRTAESPPNWNQRSFHSVHLHPYYRDHFGYRKGDLPQSEGNLRSNYLDPLYPSMTEVDVSMLFNPSGTSSLITGGEIMKLPLRIHFSTEMAGRIIADGIMVNAALLITLVSRYMWLVESMVQLSRSSAISGAYAGLCQ